MDRRRFLSIVGGGTVGILLPYSAYRYMEQGIDAGHIGVKKFLNAGPNAALQLLTPNDDFYLTSSHGEPSVDAKAWSLAIDGLVENPLRFNYDEIRRLPPHEQVLTLECISNPVGGKYIGNARWKGTLLRPLLERARIKPNAKFAVSHAAEGYTTAIPVERMLSPLNFLAWEMNGEPLARRHGFPLRVFFPGKYGMKQPKWLTRIEIVDKEVLGYWEYQGWSQNCQRQIQAVIDDPQDGDRVSGANVTLCGYALAAETGISKVEISTDNGASWRPVEIFSNPSPLVWALWKFNWVSAPKGKQTLQVRATDGSGHEQIAHSQGEWPEGAMGYHTIGVTVS
jgi:DMSO/TMAO reductase YedYZ molybdopterin-dependent catalytic subunit